MIKRTNTTETFFLASKYSEIASLKQLMTNAELVIQVSNLIHQLQRERGLSNLFLASKGERLGDQLCQQIEESKSSQAEFREQLEQLDIESISLTRSSKLFNNIAFALHVLEGMPELREKIREQSIAAEDSCQAMSRIIAALLAVIFEAADLSDDPEITRALVAMFNFMQCKEYAGQERAWAALGFAAGQFEQEDLERISTLVDIQKNSLDTFREFASETQVAEWNKFETGKEHQELDRLRLVISRIEPGKDVTSEISEVWYEIATVRIDAMQVLEREQAAALISLCEQRVSEADTELKKQHDSLEMLTSLNDPTTTSYTPLLDSSLTGMDSANPGMNTDWVRALYGLVQQQAEGLRNMSDELAEARRALSERKRVERAKGLLMQFHGMSEPQAHRKLQQSAMNQKKSLIEVADILINEFEKLKDKI
ncbi:nitrate- and nitrite sensing domain-containing protein [Neptuniibacter sp.]|uniref:nitrate- and nitrite sensing domain-containing protein n=1 Tax=Neptuniibacter sp. TaxID=1962643 RepID=UPI003B5AE00B